MKTIKMTISSLFSAAKMIFFHLIMDVPPIYKGGKQSPFLNSSIRIQKQNINGSLLDNTPKIINMVTRAHFFCLMALTFTLALAADHSPLQDFCVADTKSQGISLQYASDT